MHTGLMRTIHSRPDDAEPFISNLSMSINSPKIKSDVDALFIQIRNRLAFLKKLNGEKDRDIEALKQRLIQCQSVEPVPDPNQLSPQSTANAEFSKFVAIQSKMKKDIKELHLQRMQREIEHQAEIIGMQRDHEMALNSMKQKLETNKTRIESLETKQVSLEKERIAMVKEIDFNHLTVSELRESLRYSRSQYKGLQSTIDPLLEMIYIDSTDSNQNNIHSTESKKETLLHRVDILKNRLLKLSKLQQTVLNMKEEMGLYKQEIHRLNDQITSNIAPVSPPPQVSFETICKSCRNQNMDTDHYLITPFLERQIQRDVRMRKYLENPVTASNDPIQMHKEKETNTAAKIRYYGAFALPRPPPRSPRRKKEIMSSGAHIDV